MTINLPADLEAKLAAEVEAGVADSADRLVAGIVRAYLDHLAAFRTTLDEADADYELNGGIPWADVKASMQARLKAYGG